MPSDVDQSFDYCRSGNRTSAIDLHGKSADLYQYAYVLTEAFNDLTNLVRSRVQWHIDVRFFWVSIHGLYGHGERNFWQPSVFTSTSPSCARRSSMYPNAVYVNIAACFLAVCIAWAAPMPQTKQFCANEVPTPDGCCKAYPSLPNCLGTRLAPLVRCSIN